MFYANQSNLVMITSFYILEIKQYSKPGFHKLSKNLGATQKF
jgi:hypothetical protein